MKKVKNFIKPSQQQQQQHPDTATHLNGIPPQEPGEDNTGSDGHQPMPLFETEPHLYAQVSPLRNTPESIKKAIEQSKEREPQDLPQLSSTNPISLFSARPNAFQPDWGLYTMADQAGRTAPLPTNEWWENLILDNGENPVATYPYMVKTLSDRIHVSAPTFHASEAFALSVWHQDWSIEPAASGSYTPYRRSVIAYDDVSVTVEWMSQTESTSMRTCLVKGQPFVTAQVFNWSPLLTTSHAILAIDFIDTGIFKVCLNNSQMWIVATNPPISWTWMSTSTLSVASSHRASDATTSTAEAIRCEPGEFMHMPSYTGVIRIAHLPNIQMLDLLQKGIRTYPIGGRIDIEPGPYPDIASITVNYKTEGGDPEQLLMLALPHHVNSLLWPPPINSGSGGYRCIKGPLDYVRGNKWVMCEDLVPLGFSGPVPIDPQDREPLANYLRDDIEGLGKQPVPMDPYFGGKWIARCARLCLIADELGAEDLREAGLGYLKRWLEEWLVSDPNDSQPSRLVYDTTWRGLVSRAGIHDPHADFGNGRYNDHHFHYGYFVYAAAVAGKLDIAWLMLHQEAVLALLRDYANPTRLDSSFPRLRHFDLFDGHSWAAGTFAFGDSRNQESTSEAVNAYYGAYLLAKVLNRSDLETFYHTLTCLEARTARQYWHIGDESSRPKYSHYSQYHDLRNVYPKPFGENHYVVGILWGTKVDFTTFFGANREYIYGIQFLPYTPATHLILDPGWVEGVWEKELKQVAEQAESGAWREIVTLPLAVVSKEEARSRIQEIREHDDGNSATNALYFVSTSRNRK
ncbi:hypothetical protein EV182_001182 [Spiromyces aspiralis]|uniref:Uncharacterized protein n=1 Tax=Spiromyces aspiralis TaxID=68401 RepID=A0ACC1HFY4_9FUNG|nr:hypothetical protein EV182_001182 [Spiromyces aspiralis]